jgi:hypothetical protein
MTHVLGLPASDNKARIPWQGKLPGPDAFPTSTQTVWPVYARPMCEFDWSRIPPLTAQQKATWDAATRRFMAGDEQDFVDYEELAVDLDLSRRPHTRGSRPAAP